MVFDHGIGLQHIGTYLASPSDVLHIPADARCLGRLFLLFYHKELCLQHLHGLLLVLELGTLILAGYHDSCWKMGNPDG